MAEEEEQVVPKETEEEVSCTSLCASLNGPILGLKQYASTSSVSTECIANRQCANMLVNILGGGA